MKCACVIDKDRNYVDYVAVIGGKPQFHTINDDGELMNDETLVDVLPPQMRLDADHEGFIKPVLNENNEWQESLAPEEIAQWESEHPGEVHGNSGPTELEKLRADLDYTMLMMGLDVSET